MNRSFSPIRTICIYCGSQPGLNPAYRDAARILGAAMAERGIGLVYGGGTCGIMGTIADAVLEGHGHVTGIIPEFLMDKEASHESLERLNALHITRDMHERKHLMFEKSDAFVALPGGIGTLEELIEIMTWAQLGRHAKPIVLADIDGFWAPLKSLIDHMTNQGFIHTAERVRPLVVSDPHAILPAILTAATPREEADSDVIARM
ncbi:TIGR00730 family Rossman fold protein [Pseudohoeflea coraliihabitans]|uniref:Cytokinin riboside 5'-monophosphate phosphoribohydrolase n=1 Tax=Pseudohoeflea coraliihabitans TaxID=2860393 RepID=A0ABS6WQ42_9HYPH|nr:TIGR00730 family Rossman fold protein [Pseudohoeflea sp. DP4N28-3]MBW3097895.1 TIGR00730 family Rossman fold protein [Pseudohoeflea sp. DP4N28-3]